MDRKFFNSNSRTNISLLHIMGWTCHFIKFHSHKTKARKKKSEMTHPFPFSQSINLSKLKSNLSVSSTRNFPYFGSFIKSSFDQINQSKVSPKKSLETPVLCAKRIAIPFIRSFLFIAKWEQPTRVAREKKVCRPWWKLMPIPSLYKRNSVKPPF